MRAVANVVVTGTGGWVGNLGILLGIWLGTLFVSTISHALSRTHGVKEDRNWWSKYIIAFFLLFWFGIAILFCFSAMVFGETLAGIAEVNWQLSVPLQSWVAALSLPLTALALIGLALGLYLLTPENYLTVKQALPGAVLFAIGWMIGDETLSALRHEIRPLQSDVSCARIHHRPALLDVPDLFLPPARREAERDPAARTRTRRHRVMRPPRKTAEPQPA